MVGGPGAGLEGLAVLKHGPGRASAMPRQGAEVRKRLLGDMPPPGLLGQAGREVGRTP